MNLETPATAKQGTDKALEIVKSFYEERHEAKFTLQLSEAELALVLKFRQERVSVITENFGVKDGF